MAGRKKKLPWNAGLKIPGLNAPAHVPPPPAPPYTGSMGLTTGHMVEPVEEWECLLCEQLALGGVPTVPEHSLRCPKRDPAVKS